MRITAEEKAATRKRILSTAKQLFRTKGFYTATTREIANELGIAAGTMFNYFPSKEAIVVELAAGLLAKGKTEFEKNRRTDVELEEVLFESIAIQLRVMRTIRKYIQPVLDTLLSPADHAGASNYVRDLSNTLTVFSPTMDSLTHRQFSETSCGRSTWECSRIGVTISPQNRKTHSPSWINRFGCMSVG